MIGVGIRDLFGGSKAGASVTPSGQLVTAPVSYSTPVFREMNTTTTFNFVKPKAGCRIVVTDILLYANKDLAANDATVQIFEADSATLANTSSSSTIFKTEMIKQTSRDFIGLNLVTNEGKWINATTTHASVFAVVMGYHINADINTALILPAT